MFVRWHVGLGKHQSNGKTSVIIPIHKKGDKRKCTNYRGISLISVPGKVYAKCREKKCREIVEPKRTDAQCGFRPSRSTMDQIFALQQIFEKSDLCLDTNAREKNSQKTALFNTD